MRLFWIIFYRMAYRVMQVFWALKGRRPEGAFVAMWCDGKVLLVSTSYLRYYTFPGGGKKRNETPVETAVREAREEVGVSLSADALTRMDSEVDAAGFARERIALFETHFDVAPDIKIDGREIVAAEWFDLASPETRKLWPLCMVYMDFKRQQASAL